MSCPNPANHMTEQLPDGVITDASDWGIVANGQQERCQCGAFLGSGPCKRCGFLRQFLSSTGIEAEMARQYTAVIAAAPTPQRPGVMTKLLEQAGRSDLDGVAQFMLTQYEEQGRGEVLGIDLNDYTRAKRPETNGHTTNGQSVNGSSPPPVNVEAIYLAARAQLIQAHGPILDESDELKPGLDQKVLESAAFVAFSDAKAAYTAATGLDDPDLAAGEMRNGLYVVPQKLRNQIARSGLSADHQSELRRRIVKVGSESAQRQQRRIEAEVKRIMAEEGISSPNALERVSAVLNGRQRQPKAAVSKGSKRQRHVSEATRQKLRELARQRKRCGKCGAFMGQGACKRCMALQNALVEAGISTERAAAVRDRISAATRVVEAEYRRRNRDLMRREAREYLAEVQRADLALPVLDAIDEQFAGDPPLPTVQTATKEKWKSNPHHALVPDDSGTRRLYGIVDADIMLYPGEDYTLIEWPTTDDNQALEWQYALEVGIGHISGRDTEETLITTVPAWQGVSFEMGRSSRQRQEIAAAINAINDGSAEGEAALARYLAQQELALDLMARGVSGQDVAAPFANQVEMMETAAAWLHDAITVLSFSSPPQALRQRLAEADEAEAKPGVQKCRNCGKFVAGFQACANCGSGQVKDGGDGSQPVSLAEQPFVTGLQASLMQDEALLAQMSNCHPDDRAETFRRGVKTAVRNVLDDPPPELVDTAVMEALLADSRESQAVVAQMYEAVEAEAARREAQMEAVPPSGSAESGAGRVNCERCGKFRAADSPCEHCGFEAAVEEEDWVDTANALQPPHDARTTRQTGQRRQPMEGRIEGILEQHGLLDAFYEAEAGEFYLKLENGGWQPLTIEKIGNNEVAVTHWTTGADGEVMTDTEITYRLPDWQPTSLTQLPVVISGGLVGGGYQPVYTADGKGYYPRSLQGTKQIGRIWASNLTHQGWLGDGVTVAEVRVGQAAETSLARCLRCGKFANYEQGCQHCTMTAEKLKQAQEMVAEMVAAGLSQAQAEAIAGGFLGYAEGDNWGQEPGKEFGRLLRETVAGIDEDAAQKQAVYRAVRAYQTGVGPDGAVIEPDNGDSEPSPAANVSAASSHPVQPVPGVPVATRTKHDVEYIGTYTWVRFPDGDPGQEVRQALREQYRAAWKYRRNAWMIKRIVSKEEIARTIAEAEPTQDPLPTGAPYPDEHRSGLVAVPPDAIFAQPGTTLAAGQYFNHNGGTYRLLEYTIGDSDTIYSNGAVYLHNLATGEYGYWHEFSAKTFQATTGLALPDAIPTKSGYLRIGDVFTTAGSDRRFQVSAITFGEDGLQVKARDLHSALGGTKVWLKGQFPEEVLIEQPQANGVGPGQTRCGRCRSFVSPGQPCQRCESTIDNIVLAGVPRETAETIADSVAQAVHESTGELDRAETAYRAIQEMQAAGIYGRADVVRAATIAADFMDEQHAAAFRRSLRSVGVIESEMTIVIDAARESADQILQSGSIDNTRLSLVLGNLGVGVTDWRTAEFTESVVAYLSADMPERVVRVCHRCQRFVAADGVCHKCENLLLDADGLQLPEDMVHRMLDELAQRREELVADYDQLHDRVLGLTSSYLWNYKAESVKAQVMLASAIEFLLPPHAVDAYQRLDRLGLNPKHIPQLLKAAEGDMLIMGSGDAWTRTDAYRRLEASAWFITHQNPDEGSRQVQAVLQDYLIAQDTDLAASRRLAADGAGRLAGEAQSGVDTAAAVEPNEPGRPGGTALGETGLAGSDQIITPPATGVDEPEQAASGPIETDRPDRGATAAAQSDAVATGEREQVETGPTETAQADGGGTSGARIAPAAAPFPTVRDKAGKLRCQRCGSFVSPRDTSCKRCQRLGHELESLLVHRMPKE
jgi:hypothetical protein